MPSSSHNANQQYSHQNKNPRSQPLLRSLQQTFKTTSVYHMHPLHLTSKWFHCTIIQHQGLGVYRIIKRSSIYYWSHAKGSMQILGRQGHEGFLCFQKQNIFSDGHIQNTVHTLKKCKYWKLRKFENFPIIILTFLRGVCYIAWMLGWCLPNFIMQSLIASSKNKFLCIKQNVSFYL